MMKELQKLSMIFLLLTAGAVTIFAQDPCKTWSNLSNEEEVVGFHSIYRPYVKGKQAADLASMDESNFSVAFENWEKCYKNAPAADGQRPTHYSDGRLFYKAMAQKETDEAKKNEYNEMILKLYDEQIQCYKNEAFLLGRKAFDMFYMPAYGYRPSTLEAFKQALEKGGNNIEYIILEPMAQVMAYLYSNDQLGQPETQALYTKLETAADHNIANNKRYGQYFESAKARMVASFQEIEDEVFDCEYFKKQLIPDYRANPDDLDVIKYVFNKLRTQGCDSTQAIMIELSEKYTKIATEMNVQIEAERRANNPGYDAVQLQKEKKYEEAVARYQEAIDIEEDPAIKAEYLYSIAYIQTWQFKQYNSARSNARKAAGLKGNWGKPYILIGDMYASSAASCGSDGYTRGLAVLAAIDKYSYAKSIDSSVAGDANEKIGRISGAKPTKDDVFMRGSQGKSEKVPCWIGETVKVRF
jgi:hypothetical protein